MTQLINMKFTKRKKEDIQPLPMEEERYPYGLRIDLGDESVKKLGFDFEKIGAGNVVTVTAKAKISSIRINEERDGSKNKSVELQITDMAVVGNGKSTMKEEADEIEEGRKV